MGQEYLTNAIKPRRLDFTEIIWSDTLPTSNKLASGKAEQHQENAQQRKRNRNKNQFQTAGSKLRSRLNNRRLPQRFCQTGIWEFAYACKATNNKYMHLYI